MIEKHRRVLIPLTICQPYYTRKHQSDIHRAYRKHKYIPNYHCGDELLFLEYFHLRNHECDIHRRSVTVISES